MSHVETITSELAKHDDLIQAYRLDFDALVAVGAGLLREIEINKPVLEDTLDDIVYDCAGEAGARAANDCADETTQEEAIADAETYAMEINGGGYVAQIAFILASFGAKGGSETIREALALPR